MARKAPPPDCAGTVTAAEADDAWNIPDHRRMILQNHPTMDEGAAYYKAWHEGQEGYEARKDRRLRREETKRHRDAQWRTKRQLKRASAA